MGEGGELGGWTADVMRNILLDVLPPAREALGEEGEVDETKVVEGVVRLLLVDGVDGALVAALSRPNLPLFLPLARSRLLPVLHACVCVCVCVCVWQRERVGVCVRSLCVCVCVCVTM